MVWRIVKLHHQLLALAACVIVVSLGLVTCVQQHDALDTAGLPIAALTRSDSPDAPASQPSTEERPDADIPRDALDHRIFESAHLPQASLCLIWPLRLASALDLDKVR